MYACVFISQLCPLRGSKKTGTTMYAQCLDTNPQIPFPIEHKAPITNRYIQGWVEKLQNETGTTYYARKTVVKRMMDTLLKDTEVQ